MQVPLPARKLSSNGLMQLVRGLVCWSVTSALATSCPSHIRYEGKSSQRLADWEVSRAELHRQEAVALGSEGVVLEDRK